MNMIRRVSSGNGNRLKSRSGSYIHISVSGRSISVSLNTLRNYSSLSWNRLCWLQSITWSGRLDAALVNNALEGTSFWDEIARQNNMHVDDFGCSRDSEFERSLSGESTAFK